ncbi:MAG TPA: hypothetical protein VEW66_04980, partial [Thermomicrobiales bacterium]|nr:hypothetical protein [Thermomicrobiales bacterium]
MTSVAPLAPSSASPWVVRQSSPSSSPTARQRNRTMPRELVATAPRTPTLRDYDDPPLGPSDIHIKTELASPKHGTELVGYRNDPVASRPYAPAWGAVIPQDP